MSGAGRTTAANVLEDLGWYVVDNLPPQMLKPLAELVGRADGALPKLAVVVDVRGRSLYSDLAPSLRELRDQGVTLRVLFLDSSDEALVRRFESVRRPHPLQGEGRILDGITNERDLVAEIRASADLLIDTTGLNVHELARAVTDAFGDSDSPSLRLTVMSFGFKYGIPVDADHVADVRFLPNPYWLPHLRDLRGTDQPVSDFVLGQNGADTFISRYEAALEPVIEGYLRENRRYATIAIGCTGGKHRSVAIAVELGRRLDKLKSLNASIVHRDLGRE
ncbi:RNase adapter RapZ [Saxibacter everestensis]|uniref:RNase adapter RapZ n=2 Tax=Saxibacter everestensis TaxID=2909229 RepID=A0ABY8QYE0_9MICO|nr:RNase adapter RapZ [Brevibacteriaceae bacterium ZFBP1038]